MFVIIGASGKVGYATSQALRQADMPVRAVLRDAAKAEPLRKIGCEIAMADLQDTTALTKALSNATAVQVIIPPSLQAPDPAQEMHKTAESIATALEQTQPKRILAISDYGAHITHDIGMPSIFHAIEERLRHLSGQKIFLRSAEHMQNWSRAIPAALASGNLASFSDPVDRSLPTISAPDLGKISAELLLHPPSPDPELAVVHAEGPHRYSAHDVAVALSELSGKPITAGSVPRSQWREIFERGVSPSLAEHFVRSNDAQNQGGLIDVEDGVGEVRYGRTELRDALRGMLPNTE